MQKKIKTIMWPKRSKKDRLPIFMSDLGPFQSRRYHMPDLYHEETISLDAPFDLVSSSGNVTVRTVLLLGDQNAGKTTFLHCFVDQDDDCFTRLNSMLPVLEACFLNSRFLPEGSSMDELPFLDTDLARTSLLLSMSDWNFLLEERGLPLESSKSPFMCLQLLEIGGDHLDRMIAAHTLADERLKKIIHQSLMLVSSAQKIVYIVNGSTAKSNHVLIRQRFDFLRSKNPLAQFGVLLSRACDDEQGARLSNALGMPVSPFCTLREDGEINVDGVVSALCQLVLLSESDDSSGDAVAAEHLVNLLVHVRDTTNLWTSAQQLYHHMSEQHEHCDQDLPNAAPLSHVLGRFANAVSFLESRRMILRRSGALTSRFGLEWSGKRWWEKPIKVDGDEEIAVRLPVCEEVLRDVLSGTLDSAGKFWGDAHICESSITHLERLIAAETNQKVFLVLMDDFILCQPSVDCFPLPLQLDLNMLDWTNDLPPPGYRWIKINQ